MGKPGSLLRCATGLSFCAMVLLGGCGGGGGDGGGGGGGTPVSYSGNTSAAVVSTTNASALTVNVVGGDTGTGVLGAASVSGSVEAAEGRLEIARRLSRAARGTVQLPAPDAKVATAFQVDETVPCDNGVGTSRTFGTIDDVTFTGTLTIVYSNCLFGSDTLDGPATLRVDGFDGVFLTDTTVSYTRIAIRGPGLSIDATGSLRTQLNVGANMETVTENLVTLNNLNGRTTKSENLVFTYTYDNLVAPSSFTALISGRIYHSVHGYVDVTTNAPLDFDSLSQLFPGSGQFTLIGAAGSAVRAIALSATLTRLELDLDGNTVFDIAATLGWADLSGPIGADLADNDGDGMHNGWESANGLDPEIDDSASDFDMDGSPAIEEYFAGSRANDPGSTPPSVGLSITIGDSPDPVMVGGNLVYTIAVSNSSAIAATGVEVMDTLPAGVSLVSVNTEQGSCLGTSTITCSLGTVSAFNNIVVTIIVSPTTAGPLSNTVTVSSSTFDADPSNNSATANTTVNPAVANLGVTMTDNPDPALVGGNLTYTVNVDNSAGSVASDVVVTGTLPASVNFVSATPAQGSCSGTATLTCSLGTLGVFSSSTVTIVVQPAAQGVISFTASATTTTADANLSNNTATSTTTVGLPAAGIQGMIDLAATGDTILVLAGIYTGGIDFNGKNVTLQSVAGPALTVINGSNGTAVRMGPNGTIRGFTITGSFSSAIVAQGAGSKIVGNVFEGNSNGLSGIGAAIHGNAASPTIEGNSFRNNSCDSQFGSGVVAFINFSSPQIVNNVFHNNPCSAITFLGPEFTTPRVMNNTIAGNSIGIRVDRRVPHVTQVFRNNVVVENGIGLQLDFGTDAGNPVWTNNLVFGNTTDYLGTASQTGTNGNLSVDPMFVDAPAGNYRLQPGSPAIDAGSPTDAPTVDFEGTARPLDGNGDTVPAVDIGAFEAVP
jgi:uncharacterized repeat protein (TIGR01451 family)